MLNLFKPLAARLVGLTEPLGGRERAIVRAIGRDVPLPLVRWAARAIFTWPGVEQLPIPVYAIHGDHDTALDVRRVTSDEIIRGGGHILSLSHPDEVNAFIARCMERSQGPPQGPAQPTA